MFKTRRKPKKIEKINVIPILDAVFIFIFFLLMSAQFVDIHEIGSDAPAVKTLDQKQKRPPLNLTLVIDKNGISIRTGMESKVVKYLPKKGNNYDTKRLYGELLKLKKKHVDETSVIFRPKSNVPYEELVVIMDAVREIKGGPIVAKNHKGKTIKTQKLFEQIIFETII